MVAIFYKAFTIEKNPSYDSLYDPRKIMFYPTEEGINDDADYDYESGRYYYCGNCKWADTLEEAKGEIDELQEYNVGEKVFDWLSDAITYASERKMIVEPKYQFDSI